MRVFVGVPAFGSWVHCSLLALVSELGDGFDVRVYGNNKGIPFARNFLANKFLDGRWERLWFLDADVIPSRDWRKLFDVSGDVVGGIYPMIRLENDGVRWAAQDEDMRTGGVVDADFVPFGNVVLSRAVVEAMVYDWSVAPPAIFREHREANGRVKVTDDVEFCRRAREKGFTVKLHGGVRFGHWKMSDLAIHMREGVVV